MVSQVERNLDHDSEVYQVWSMDRTQWLGPEGGF